MDVEFSFDGYYPIAFLQNSPGSLLIETANRN
jgi:hypothetical protein